MSANELNTINIKEIHKTINQLQRNDILSEPENLKLHIFSNVLDIQEINLDDLAQLIYNTQSGTNYFICVNPKNSESQTRIDDFHQKLSNLFSLSDIDRKDTNITDKSIYRMTENEYSNQKPIYSNQYPIYRYHRIFKIN